MKIQFVESYNGGVRALTIETIVALPTVDVPPTNHSHRYKTYRCPAIPSLHWRTETNELWSDHRFGLVPLVKPDMRSA